MQTLLEKPKDIRFPTSVGRTRYVLLDGEPDSLDESNYFRAPESETYGRSLSTIRRLGAFMIDRSLSEVILSPEAEQARVEFYTSVEEGFGTDMELGKGLEVRDFDRRPVIDGKVMAKDLKTPVSRMTEAGLICAEETAKKDRHFSPQLTRSQWDHHNAVIVDEMAQGKTEYNTRIVISPFPEEAAARSGEEYWRRVGYVPHLKRGFVQLYHTTKNGEVLAGSLSFDGSNKQRLREVFSKHGVDIPDGEITDNWLRYAVTGTLTENEAKALALGIANQAADPKYRKTTNTIDVTREYGPVMDQVFNESYVHVCESLVRGRQTEEAAKLIDQFTNNAHSFNGHYATALYKMRANKDKFTDDDAAVLHEMLVYSTIEMMRALHLNKGGLQSVNAQLAPEDLQYIDPASFQSMLSGFGADGARNGRTYSACGLSISLGGDKDDVWGNPQKVFGGMLDDQKNEDSEDGENKKGWRWKRGVCRVDNCPTRPGQTEVGPCEVCRCCQRWFDKGRDPTKLYTGVKSAVKEVVNSKDGKNSKQMTVHKADKTKDAPEAEEDE